MLPAAQLAARVAEAYRLTGELTAQVEGLSARLGQLERQTGKDSSCSSRPPSSDSPNKKNRDRSLRERGKRRPGKQPGEPRTTVKLIDDPGERFWYRPAACSGCGTDLAAWPVTARRRHQVTGIEPARRRRSPGTWRRLGNARAAGRSPGASCRRRSGRGLATGPETHAQAANLTCGHHIPVWRPALLLCQLAGIAVSTGWMAGIQGKAAVLVGASGFITRVRELLKTAPALHADETRPARRAGPGTFTSPAPGT